MANDWARHPCFDEAARHSVARIHLPVAPDCNVQCNFCKRKYDCANESRPGVTSAVLSPTQAVEYLDRMLAKDPRIAVVGIAGPGDPFATPEKTLDTLRSVRERHPELLLCVASNGLNVPQYVDAIAELKVSHMTLTVNAVDAEIAARIYAWVRDGKRICRGRPAGELLWARQAVAIAGLKRHGITVKINTIVIPGINDQHVVSVARKVAALGTDIANCVALYPVAGTVFGEIQPPTGEQVAAIRNQVAEHLPIMQHCTRCRADAVGLLGEPLPAHAELAMTTAAAPAAARPYVAAATLEGVLVNQHLGEAQRLAVFAPADGGFQLVETRPTPTAGGGPGRWHALAETFNDCRALLVASAGDSPRVVLGEYGIRVIQMEGLIEEGLSAVYRGLTIRAPARAHRCGIGCAGDGRGCG